MENNKIFGKMQKIIKDVFPLTACEILVILLVILGGGALDLLGVIKFNYKIISGAMLGGVVCVLNYTFLTVSVDKAINDYLALRGDKEMDEEEAERFAQENSMPIQNAIKLSYIIRTVSMIATLLVAFLTKAFNPIATAIPLLAFRPLITLIESIKGKAAK